MAWVLSHDIGITPDGKILWATSKWYGYVFAYSMPELKLRSRSGTTAVLP